MAAADQPAEAGATFTESHGDARIPALDGLRGLAIILVMNLHFTDMSLRGSNFLIRPGSTVVDRTWLKLSGIGWSGVDLFFVLSGFLITGILYDSRATARRYFRTFYARRILRIFPVYYALLVVVMLLVPWVVSSERPAVAALVDHRFWYYTYTINLRVAFAGLSTDFGLLGHLWSLAVEEQFYFVWPALVLLLPRRGLIAACAVAIIGAPLLRVALDVAGGAQGQIRAYVLMPARMDALAVGAAIALVVRGPGGIGWLSPLVRPVAALSGCVLVALYVVRDGLGMTDVWVQAVGYSALAFLWGSLVVRVLAARPESRLTAPFRGRVMAWFGRYSYALYLVHVPVAVLMAQRVDIVSPMFSIQGSRLPGVLAFWAAAFGISAACAVASWQVIERPFLALKLAFPYGDRAATGDRRLG